MNVEHRSNWREAPVAEAGTGPVTGQVSLSDFDPVARLKELRLKPMPSAPHSTEQRILHISLYCYKSFPIRIFHVLSLKDGMDSHALFFKNNFTNRHLPISDREMGLLEDLIKKIDPHVITMSVMAPYALAARQMVKAIRKISAADVIIGGKYPTIAPNEALEFADYACKGDGEILLLNIHERLRQGRDLKNLKGLWYKEADGQIVDMGQESLYQEMDDIPYPAINEAQMHFIEKNTVSTVDPEIFESELLMMAGRGCVYLCSFCVNSLLIPMNRGNGRFVRIRSPENVLEEIDYRLSKYKNPEMITFNDEIFGVIDEWVADFAKKYKAACGLPFECELVPTLIKEQNIRQLVDAGMVSLHFGVQSGHDEIRKDVMHRPGTGADLREKAEILRRCGIKPQYDIILENPFDTEDSLVDALELLLSFETPINLNTYKMQYFPHYPFTKMALAAGYIGEEHVTDEFIANSVLYNMVYRPKFPALNRRDYLENCIYLIPWTGRLTRNLVGYLSKKHNPFFGFAVTCLAQIRYYQEFEQVMYLVWFRRYVLGFKMLVRGDFKALLSKIKLISKSRHYENLKTGRISTRQ
ncbi:MAG: B12-binding domain-containing radical SAM protein [Rhodospirillales bacterium]|nr:B12-binding domain-containing radical SAM protein [Rhodospirillales bacterium]